MEIKPAFTKQEKAPAHNLGIEVRFYRVSEVVYNLAADGGVEKDHIDLGEYFSAAEAICKWQEIMAQDTRRGVRVEAITEYQDGREESRRLR